ncbi:trypsin alpha-3-like [Anopheles aquasalis]|uniref:trypsin alpha-3-like n=1 Tax=Anopheles aquasalis TaxID=42839 RepID=UPI00215A2329|nr:trypsin alpha-3-like [Anopheles aquasalis]
MKGFVYLLLAFAITTSANVVPEQEQNIRALLEDEYDPFLPFIAGGTNAALGQFPSVVAVGLPAPPNNAFCGGVILNVNHVLTSARCVLLPPPQNTLLFTNQVTILSGSLQLNFGAPRIGVTAIYVHPQYNPFTYEHNLAVLRTNADFFFPVVPVPGIGLATFYEEIPFDGQACQVVGWNNATASPVQQFIPAPILNRDTCNGLAVHTGRVRESMVCAGATGTGPGVCASNLGTGLFCEGRLAGILTTGLGCGQANNPGVYAQIRWYLPWIRDQFARQDIPLGGSVPIPAM